MRPILGLFEADLKPIFKSGRCGEGILAAGIRFSGRYRCGEVAVVERWPLVDVRLYKGTWTLCARSLAFAFALAFASHVCVNQALSVGAKLEFCLHKFSLLRRHDCSVTSAR